MAQVDWVPEIAGPYVLLMSGKDGTPGNDKSHKSRPVLGINTDNNAPGCVVFDGMPANSKIASSARSIHRAFLGRRFLSGSDGYGSYRAPYSKGTIRSTDGNLRYTLNDVLNAPSTQIKQTLMKEINNLFIWCGHATARRLVCKPDDYLTADSLSVVLPSAVISPYQYKLAVIIGCNVGNDHINGENASGTIRTAFLEKGWKIICPYYYISMGEAQRLGAALDQYLDRGADYPLDSVDPQEFRNKVIEAGKEAGITIYANTSGERVNVDYFYEIP